MLTVNSARETCDDVTTIVLLTLLFVIGFLIAAAAPAAMYDLSSSLG